MKIAVRHRTVLDYESEVMDSVMDARLGPRTDEHQTWETYSLQVVPGGSVRQYTDGFGNVAHLITVMKPHRSLDVTMNGVVETSLADPFEQPRSQPEPLGPAEHIELLGPSPLVPPSAEIDAIVAPFRGDGRPVIEVAQALMRAVHERFEYRPDVTTVMTTVPEALSHSTGVCQDFAHVLIALCRALGIPARYVSGYILGGGGSAPTRGTEASHAWVEAFTPTHGWRGFDPTNDLMASQRHVKMAVGRDYRDVPPTRGAYRGTAEERLAVTVTTRRVDRPAS